jgi:general secretion pathway protein G
VLVRHQGGFSLVEVMLVLAILGTLAAISLPVYTAALQRARIARAIGDIKAIDTDLRIQQVLKGKLPTTLAEIGRERLRDPWGNAYQYLNFESAKGKGAMRKDRFLVPINSDFDLYSMGPDGKTVPPLNAKVSRDDIVRANDGGFVGLASEY